MEDLRSWFAGKQLYLCHVGDICLKIAARFEITFREIGTNREGVSELALGGSAPGLDPRRE